MFNDALRNAIRSLVAFTFVTVVFVAFPNSAEAQKSARVTASATVISGAVPESLAARDFQIARVADNISTSKEIDRDLVRTESGVAHIFTDLVPVTQEDAETDLALTSSTKTTLRGEAVRITVAYTAN